MFKTLIESKPQKKRSASGTLFSVVFHTTIVTLALYATANARIAEPEKPKQEDVKFVEVKKEEPKPPEPKPEPPKPKPPPPRRVQRPQPVVAPPRVQAPAPPKGFQVLQAPVTIPVKLPDVDASRAITNESDFTGKGVAGGTGSGREGGTGSGSGTGPPVDLNQTFRDFEVETEAAALGGATPEYPSSLREQGVEGQVVLEFVVNENGRVDMGSVKVIESSNALFTAAVRAAMPGMRFRAAKIGGRAVKQYVRQPFRFKLNRR
jgi:protein TonB